TDSGFAISKVALQSKVTVPGIDPQQFDGIIQKAKAGCPVSQLCDRMYVMYAGSVIESGSTQTLIHHPVHPYSIGLLRCAPENGEPREILPAIPGTVPNLSHL
ncbi:oligopeptide/dipeptide ABC transporter ATP-binding protein, partial [Acinetobacter baumannii]|uniref:oligopeptide/dipeptide ABC transporter ATP-binding protein n=1 Tax=Acinetobacter baumannii TaxID=470 RepID=UPI003AFB1ED3